VDCTFLIYDCPQRRMFLLEARLTCLRRVFHIPANESVLGLVLCLCVVTLGLLSLALVWQAQIIANQRDAIRWLETIKVGV
jgi:hypothetical protein